MSNNRLLSLVMRLSYTDQKKQDAKRDPLRKPILIIP